MELRVEDGGHVLVANVAVDPASPFAAAPGEPPGFVCGHYEPGPGFERVRAMLAVFNEAYERGDHSRAFALHSELDTLGLVAIDSAGRRFPVSNVYFQDGALLFAAVDSKRTAAPEQDKE